MNIKNQKVMVPMILRAEFAKLRALVPYALFCLTCFVPHVPPAYVLSYFTCLVPCVLSCFRCLVPNVPSCYTYMLYPHLNYDALAKCS